MDGWVESESESECKGTVQPAGSKAPFTHSEDDVEEKKRKTGSGRGSRSCSESQVSTKSQSKGQLVKMPIIRFAFGTNRSYLGPLPDEFVFVGRPSSLADSELVPGRAHIFAQVLFPSPDPQAALV